MRALITIYRREMGAYFHSPIAYVLIVGYLALSGYFFYSGLAFYSMASLQAMQNPLFMKINLTEMLVAPLLTNYAIFFLFAVPLLTMRLLSEERKTGTIELLLSYPVTDTSVILAKFLAAWTMVAMILALTWVPMGLLFWLGQPHLPAMLSGYLGLLLMGGCFVAFGLLCSAATENQIVAAVACFFGLLFIWALGWSSEVVGKDLGEFLQNLSIVSHFERLPKGLIDTADLAYFVLFMGFFLFASIRTLEAKRWKG
jgi:ABC-2 type transport system permease protein